MTITGKENNHDPQVEENTMSITKNTSISIGLGIALAGVIFYGGFTIGSIGERQQAHSSMEMHNGMKIKLKEYVPRNEVQLLFNGVNGKLEIIQKQQTQILLNLNK